MNLQQGYAYPHGVGYEPFEHGLTKRELIAAMALQGLITSSEPFRKMDGTGKATGAEDFAAIAVAWADALIEELSK